MDIFLSLFIEISMNTKMMKMHIFLKMKQFYIMERLCDFVFLDFLILLQLRLTFLWTTFVLFFQYWDSNIGPFFYYSQYTDHSYNFAITFDIALNIMLNFFNHIFFFKLIHGFFSLFRFP